MRRCSSGRGERGSRQLHRPRRFQAETLRPPVAEELPVEELPEEVPVDVPVVEEEVPSRFRTISSLLLAGRLKVTCGVELEPC
jgi:hypothetical protein